MKYIISILMLINLTVVSAQEMPERREVRRGNNKYEKESYEEAIEHYGKAIVAAPGSIEPIFNMGSALIKSEQYEEADKLLNAIVADTLQSNEILAHAYYNLGNSQFQQQKYEEALESYKQSILRDPTDVEAKYNYAYTKAILDQQQQDQDQDQDQNEDQQDQDQNQDQQDQDQNQDQNEDQQDQDQSDDQQDQDQNEDQQDQEQNQDQQDQQQDEQPSESEFSEQQQNQMLDAIQAQEDKTQEDLKERAKGVLIPGAKNW
ncbi:MAG: tetratricopeptide repeat protein [Rikenellaceae bacterium]